jgi:hypothetical protein
MSELDYVSNLQLGHDEEFAMLLVKLRNLVP